MEGAIVRILATAFIYEYSLLSQSIKDEMIKKCLLIAAQLVDQNIPEMYSEGSDEWKNLTK